MATGSFNGTNYALQASPTVGTFPSAATAGGVVYCSSDEVYASGTDLDAGSTMYCGKLPAGAVVLYAHRPTIVIAFSQSPLYAQVLPEEARILSA